MNRAEAGAQQGSSGEGQEKTLFNRGSLVAERLGNRASNLKVAGSIPGRADHVVSRWQGTSPYLPRGNVPGLTVSRSG